MSTISASTTSTTAFKITTDTTGALVFQTGASPTTAMTIDTSQNVGIGTSTPVQRLHLAQAGQPKIEFEDITNSSKGRITSGGTTGSMTFDADPDGTKAGTVMTFNIDASERMRLDASGNALVGMTSYGVTNAGVSLSPTASSSFYVAGGTAVTIGRGTSDGTAVQFNRSGTNVGTIAVATTGLTMTGTNGITFTAAQTASSDANTLDDYEEGTWTPTYGGTSSNPTVTYQTQTGTYTKVGRQVTLICEINATSASGGSGNLTIGGFPFTTSSSGGARAGFLNAYSTGFSSTTTPTSLLLESNTTYCQARTNSTSDSRSSRDIDVTVSAIYSGGRLFISMTYFTN